MTLISGEFIGIIADTDIYQIMGTAGVEYERFNDYWIDESDRYGFIIWWTIHRFRSIVTNRPSKG